MTENDARRIQALAEARTWLNTPFRHQGRRKGSGVDCIGLVLVAARAVGALTPEQEAEIPNYGRLPFQNSLMKYMDRHLLRIREEHIKPLDIALIQICGRPMHVALLTDYGLHGEARAPFGLLHAMADIGRVSEQRYEPLNWTVRQFYRLPGLD